MSMMQDIRKMQRLAMRRANEFDVDGILGRLGLERRRGVLDFALPMLGVLAAGAIVGATVALLFAPSSGRRLRQDMEHKMNRLRDRYLPEHRGGNAAEGEEGAGVGSAAGMR